MAKRICEDCKKEFQYEPPTGYPDKRKYCDECSAIRKAKWEFKQNNKDLDTTPLKTQPQASKEQSNTFTEESWVYNVSVRPNSFEWGKPSHRHKVYYDGPEELKVHIKALKEAGLYEDDIFETQKI